jgi:hypothetical protein
MTIVIDHHPVLSAVAASVSMAFFIGVSCWLVAHSVRSVRAKKAAKLDRGNVVVGVLGALLFGGLAVFWWRSWSPWAVELAGDAVELKYLLSTRRIEYAELERVEFELNRAGRRHERSILRLSSGGHVYRLTHAPEPYGDLAERPVRRIFDQLVTRVPPHKVRDVRN